MDLKRPLQDHQDSDTSHPKRAKNFDVVSHGSYSGVPLVYGDYTIAWICIAGDTNTYVLGRIHRHNVVMVCLPGQYGMNNATIVATNLKRSFPGIHATLMVGIASGSPSQADLYLGDVVVGTRVIYNRIASLLRSRLSNLLRPDHPDRLFQAAYEHHPLDAPTCDDCDPKKL
ncbi:hypothetical protein C7999DRAFT_44913 [Corynascus novoguineensis]|uniref:Nucleoside phosphorylase domain-containing protein n=1 Tax=Corynascus novoguineensis TaxID=1126955 RepID=A0AAN7CK28_9PEZI|nr:hypothetical protein C7999DRAFT_44913 [Corynascus novoguineensis]